MHKEYTRQPSGLSKQYEIVVDMMSAEIIRPIRLQFMFDKEFETLNPTYVNSNGMMIYGSPARRTGKRTIELAIDGVLAQNLTLEVVLTGTGRIVEITSVKRWGRIQ